MMSDRQFHDGRILRLAPNEAFVFGSNEAGIHGAGAAKQAARCFGARRGIGNGPTGRCYALPTKDQRIRTLPLSAIDGYVQMFCAYATDHPEVRFLLTAVGCGLAGYKAAEIAPLFDYAPGNVVFPPEFRSYLAGA